MTHRGKNADEKLSTLYLKAFVFVCFFDIGFINFTRFDISDID